MRQYGLVHPKPLLFNDIMLLKSFSLILLIFLVTDHAHANNIAFTEKKLNILGKNNRSHEFIVEIADDEEKQKHGLMQRQAMDENHGMLFLFAPPKEVNMWMKDTYIPLDMIFINTDNIIVKIVENTTPLSLETISSEEIIASVLELNAGICKKLGIKANDKVTY